MADKTLDEEIEEAMRLVDGSGPPEPPPAPPERPQAPPAGEEPQMAQDSQVSPEALPAEPDLTEEAGQLDHGAPEEPEGLQVASRTLVALDEARRPRPEIACGICPNSVWFATPSDLRCYCRVMFVQTWTAQKPGEIVSCDGMFLGQE